MSGEFQHLTGMQYLANMESFQHHGGHIIYGEISAHGVGAISGEQGIISVSWWGYKVWLTRSHLSMR